jgi:predicted Zn-dependent peptidase
VIRFLGELLLTPKLDDGGFDRDFVSGEKKNLIATIESELNDKRAYAMGKLLRTMCRADSFGVPRLGDKERVAEIDAKTLYTHYRRILRESAIELFYVGSCDGAQVAALLKDMLAPVDRAYEALHAQTAFHDGGSSEAEEQMDTAQSVLCMGFVTPITSASSNFAAMQVLNVIFGGGMTSKLFQQVREKRSLCYAIGSGYYASKGIMTVSAGIDREKRDEVHQEVLNQLDACRRGEITEKELQAAKDQVALALRTVCDNPSRLDDFHLGNAVLGREVTPEELRVQNDALTAADLADAANALTLDTVFFLRGEAEA